MREGQLGFTRALGVVGATALAAMVSACLLWWLTDTQNELFLDAGQGLITQHLDLLGWGEWILFAALTAGIAAVFIRNLRKYGTAVQAVVAMSVVPAIAAPLYAMTLPEPTVEPLGALLGPEIHMRWPLLALGIQIASITALLIGITFGMS